MQGAERQPTIEDVALRRVVARAPRHPERFLLAPFRTLLRAMVMGRIGTHPPRLSADHRFLTMVIRP